MKTTRKLPLALLIATIVLGQSLSVYALTIPIIEVTFDEFNLKAGEVNTMTIHFENKGSYKAYDVQAFLTSSIPGITVLTEQHRVLGDISAEKTRSYEPQIYVDDSVALGAYSLTLTFTYKATAAGAITSPITVMIGVVVDETFVPKITFSSMQESIKMQAGTENDVEFTFTSNTDEEITNLQFLLSSTTPSLTVTEDIYSEYESLLPGETLAVAPSVSVTEGTPLGTYALSAMVTYQDLDGNRYDQTFSLPVTVDSAVAVRNTIITLNSMEILQESIQPGDIFTVEFDIKCTGADGYSLLSSLSFAPTSMISPISPTTTSLGDLEVDTSVTTSYQLLASGDISAGQYLVTISVTYTDTKGQMGSLTETFTILVDGLIEFDLLDVPTETVPAGEIAELEADLLLIGTESVQFVAVGVVEDNVVERVSGSDEYIGAVDPDSPIPFDVKYRISEDAPDGNHEITLKVQYRDHLNKEHEEELNLEIEVGGVVDDSPEPQQDGFWAWIRRLLGLGP